MTKKCTMCNIEQDKVNNFWKNKSHSDGVDNLCITCRRAYSSAYKKQNKNKINKYEEKYRKSEKHKTYKKQYAKRDSTKLRKKCKSYGITTEQYSKMLIAQNGLCKICGQKTVLVIDHDHNSGKVRGLLCNSCNKGLGFFRDNKDYLGIAIVYLDSYDV